MNESNKLTVTYDTPKKSWAIIFTMAFGVYTIKLAIRNHNGTHKIERTVEQIDPDYDKKYPKRN